MAMNCMYSDLTDGHCQLAGGPEYGDERADTENFACDEQGICWCDGDEYPGDSCNSYSAGWNNCERCGEVLNDNGTCPECDFDDEVCDFCGEPLGFCADDCETRDEDFEE